MLEKIELVRKENRDKLVEVISTLDQISYETISVILPVLLKNGALKLDSSVYTPVDPENLSQGIGRYLIYDHPDAENPFSIWAFAFAPRQKTVIHDHKYKGTVTVLEGPVTEKYYQPIDANNARIVNRVDRYRFHTNYDDLQGGFVHQLKRRKGLGAGISVTLHIYNMEASVINIDGNKVDRRNLNMIFFKDRSIDKKEIPPYSAAYPEIGVPKL